MIGRYQSWSLPFPPAKRTHSHTPRWRNQILSLSNSISSRSSSPSSSLRNFPSSFSRRSLQQAPDCPYHTCSYASRLVVFIDTILTARFCISSSYFLLFLFLPSWMCIRVYACDAFAASVVVLSFFKGFFLFRCIYTTLTAFLYL